MKAVQLKVVFSLFLGSVNLMLTIFVQICTIRYRDLSGYEQVSVALLFVRGAGRVGHICRSGCRNDENSIFRVIISSTDRLSGLAIDQNNPLQSGVVILQQ